MTEDNDYNPASAVDLLEMHLLGLFDDDNPDRDTIIFPRAAAKIVLELARKGLHKGRGRRGIPLTEVEKWNQELVIDEARERKEELEAALRADPDTDSKHAADQAATQAATEAAQRLRDLCGRNLSPETIKDRMQRR
jgi:Mn-dependent DtxR family transcriptional regulator